MFLLILKWQQIYDSSCLEFTFQYVSINTENEFFKNTRSFSFTFQYVSINTQVLILSCLLVAHLHSNMFLLIHRPAE